MKTPAFLIRLSLLLPMLALLPQTHARTFPAGADHFADAPEIDVRSGMSEPTDISRFSLEEWERPSEPWEGERKTAWWSWTAPASGFCRAECFYLPGQHRSFQHYITVWQGDSAETMKPAIIRSKSGEPRLQSKYWLSATGFHSVKGETYKISTDLFMNWSEDPYYIRLRMILTPAKRVHAGLWRLADEEGKTVDLGQLTLAVADNSRFTGKLTMRTGSRGFSGQFDGAGLATVTLKRLAPGAGDTTLLLDVSGSGVFSLERDGLTAGGKLAERALFSPYYPASEQQNFCIYETVLAGNAGAGRLYMRVNKLGAMKGVGMGLDGTAYTFATHLMTTELPSDCEAPIHARIRGRKGAIQLTLKFLVDNYSTPGLEGHFYRAPAPEAVFYPGGIDQAVAGSGRPEFRYPFPGPSGFLNAFDGIGELVVEDPEGEFSHGPVRAVLLQNPRGRFTFSSNYRNPVLKGVWSYEIAKGSIDDLDGRGCPITVTLIYDPADNTNKLIGLVRGRTRTYRVEVRPPDAVD